MQRVHVLISGRVQGVVEWCNDRLVVVGHRRVGGMGGAGAG